MDAKKASRVTKKLTYAETPIKRSVNILVASIAFVSLAFGYAILSLGDDSRFFKWHKREFFQKIFSPEETQISTLRFFGILPPSSNIIKSIVKDGDDDDDDD